MTRPQLGPPPHRLGEEAPGRLAARLDRREREDVAAPGRAPPLRSTRSATRRRSSSFEPKCQRMELLATPTSSARRSSDVPWTPRAASRRRVAWRIASSVRTPRCWRARGWGRARPGRGGSEADGRAARTGGIINLTGQYNSPRVESMTGHARIRSPRIGRKALVRPGLCTGEHVTLSREVCHGRHIRWHKHTAIPPAIPRADGAAASLQRPHAADRAGAARPARDRRTEWNTT